MVAQSLSIQLSMARDGIEIKLEGLSTPHFYHAAEEQLRRRLYHWVEADPRQLVKVWGREKFKRVVLICFERNNAPSWPSPDVALIGF